MKEYNPVKEGIKKHGDARVYFLALKERANSDGLTACEWDWYRARQKEWEPDVLAAEEREARRSNDMDAARRLSNADLQSVLAERSVADDAGQTVKVTGE